VEFDFSQAFAGEEHKSFVWQGRRHAALLIHGFPGTPAEMHPLAMALHERGWTVSAPLLPGFGTDIENLPVRTIKDWKRTVESALRELTASHEHIIIAGNSMGGALSIDLAARHQIHGLVLFAPFWHLDHILWRLLPVLRHIVPTFKPFRLFKPDFSDPEVQAGITRFLGDVDFSDPEVRKNILEFSVKVSIFDNIRQAGELGYAQATNISVPTLVIQGLQDELVQPVLTRQLITRLKGPVEYMEVEGDHVLIGEHNAVWPNIVRNIMQFLHAHQLGINATGIRN